MTAAWRSHSFRTPFSILLLLIGLSFAPTRAFAQSSICYAAPGGNDARDGSSWALAKADIMSCYDALPQAGGTIYFRDDGNKDRSIPACAPSDPPGCGIWIMGKRDPNYARPPAGWRRAKTTVEMIGVGSSITAGGIIPQAGVTAGGNDANHPGIWLSDVYAHTFRNLKIYYGHNPIYIGFDSNGNSPPAEGVSSWEWLFDNVSAQPYAYAGYGPTIKIGTNSVWGFFRDCQFGGNDREVANISAVSRLSGTVTVTASDQLPASWNGTLHVGIVGVADGTFDGLVSATITGTKTFTYAQNGPNATSTGGKASSDRAQVAVLNPSSGPGVGLIFFENSFFGGGGIRLYPGSSSGVFVNTLFQENGYAPPLHVSGCPGGWGVRVINVMSADRWTALPGLRMDNVSPACVNPAVAETTSVDGPAYLGGSAGPLSPLVLPDAMGQSGIYAGRVFAQADTPRRAFGPVAARYLNLANQLPSSWRVGGACNGVAGVPAQAPDGTMNAGTISRSSGNVNACFHISKVVLNVGDWIMGGVWARSERFNGFSRSAALVFSCAGCTLSNGKDYVAPPATIGGGGEWQWVSFATQAESSGTYRLVFNGIADSTHPVDFFAPILIHLASGTVSANEAAEIALHLQSYRDDAKPGQVSLLRGEQFKADSIQLGDGPTLTTGLGPPTGSATTGSIYLRRDGAAGSTCYIYEQDGWKAKF
jgi:hypothetical protein